MNDPLDFGSAGFFVGAAFVSIKKGRLAPALPARAAKDYLPVLASVDAASEAAAFLAFLAFFDDDFFAGAVLVSVVAEAAVGAAVGEPGAAVGAVF